MPPQHAMEASTSSSFYSPVASRIRNRIETIVFSYSPLVSPIKAQRRLSTDSDTSVTSTSSSSLSTSMDVSSGNADGDLIGQLREKHGGASSPLQFEVSPASATTFETSFTSLSTTTTFSSFNSFINSFDKSVLQLCFGAAGVYSCYLVYGHIQEDIFRYRSPNSNESFQSVWFLQVLECLINICFGTIGRKICGGRTPKSYRPFMVSGASQVFSKVLTSASLAAGLSFPVCILAKSAKMVPVMIGQLLLGGSKYTTKDYAFAGLVVLGTTILSMNKSTSKGTNQSFTTPLGLVFITLSLVADGITGGLQKRLKHEMEAQPPTTFDFVLFTNIAMGMVALTVAILIGDLSKGISFLYENPVLQQMVMSVCLLSAMGQFFIFYIVAQFDPMVCATVTTTRKILSVVWSIATKGHSVSAYGYLGLAVAVSGMVVGLQDKFHATKSKTTSKTGKKVYGSDNGSSNSSNDACIC
ncbi:hypothetical protein MPSEU_000446500 [Mayamaea pseudoterrestris]|nr:hypothetical protein MPSEU_000446500 [Mayamaea pseudoterrestris]